MNSRKLILLVEKLYGLAAFGFVMPSFDGMQNLTRIKFLYQSILQFATCKSGLALEIGVFKAGSTVFIAKACIKRGITQIYGVDLFTGALSSGITGDTFDAAKNRIHKYHLERNVSLIRSDSLKCPWNKKIDVLHLDGDHSYEYVTGELKKYTPFLTDGGIIIFDDYDHTHEGVTRAVHEFLLEREDFDIVTVNYGVSGSICIRKRDNLLPREDQKARRSIFDRILGRH